MQNRWPISSLIVIVFAFLSLFVYLKLAGPIPFSVNSTQTTKTDIFTAEGTGEVSAPPEVAEISLGITQRSATVEESQAKANQIIADLISALKEIGIEEKNIKTSNYSVYPDYDFSQGPQRITGYTVSQNLQIKVKPIDKINQVIETSSGKGANMIGGISFTLDEESREKLEEQARKEAVEEAKKKAHSLADAAGVRLGRIINITEEKAGSPMPFLSQAERGQAEPAAPPEVQIPTGENEIQIKITLSYELL